MRPAIFHPFDNVLSELTPIMGSRSLVRTHVA